MALLDTAKNVAKAGMGMFAVGVALTFAAQLIAPALGLEIGGLTLSAINHSNPLWIGAYFGAFGAINAAVAPVMDYLFGGAKGEAAAQSVSPAQEAVRTPEQAQEQGVSVSHCEMIEVQRRTSSAQKSI